MTLRFYPTAETERAPVQKFRSDERVNQMLIVLLNLKNCKLYKCSVYNNV